MHKLFGELFAFLAALSLLVAFVAWHGLPAAIATGDDPMQNVHVVNSGLLSFFLFGAVAYALLASPRR